MKRTASALLLLALMSGCKSLLHKGADKPAPAGGDATITSSPKPDDKEAKAKAAHLPDVEAKGEKKPDAVEAAKAKTDDATQITPITETLSRLERTHAEKVKAAEAAERAAQREAAPVLPEIVPATRGLAIPGFKDDATRDGADLPPAPKAVPSPAPSPSAAPSSGPGSPIDLTPEAAARPASSRVRWFNNHLILINYEVKEVGPSGVGGVDLWYRQEGQPWKKAEITSHQHSPYVVEVKEEGLYGFTLRARNGDGVTKGPPLNEEAPQIWAEVDVTKPEVRLTGVDGDDGPAGKRVVIRWQASDKNIGQRPVTLSYATTATGPWTLFAANVENNGRYLWEVPASVPRSFLVRVEATDQAGNIGEAQSPEAVFADHVQPSVAIVSVEAPRPAEPPAPPVQRAFDWGRNPAAAPPAPTSTPKPLPAFKPTPRPQQPAYRTPPPARMEMPPARMEMPTPRLVQPAPRTEQPPARMEMLAPRTEQPIPRAEQYLPEPQIITPLKDLKPPQADPAPASGNDGPVLNQTSARQEDTDADVLTDPAGEPVDLLRGRGR